MIDSPVHYRDCWYLYTLNPLDRYLTGKVDMEPDQTIEILMTDLDPEVMKIFTKQEASDGREATKVNLRSLSLRLTLTFHDSLSSPGSTSYSRA